MSCLVITPEIQELAKSFPHETLSGVKNMVGLWQERQIARGNKSITIESVPNVYELQKLYVSVRNRFETTSTMDKEELKGLLNDDNTFPEAVSNLAERLGVGVKKNLNTRALSVFSKGGTDFDVRLFRALAVDLIYQNDVAEKAFGMSPRERLAAIIDWEDRHRNGYDRNARSLMGYEIQVAKRNLYMEHGISTDNDIEAMRKRTAEQFTAKERLERINDIVYWFDKLLTEKHQNKLDSLASRREELLKAKEGKDKSKYSGVAEKNEAIDHLRKVLDTKVADMGISIRANKRLSEKKLETVGDIVKYNRPAFQKYTNLDSKTLKEIVDLVDKLGVSFGTDVDNIPGAEDSIKWETVEAAYDKELGDIQREMGSYDRMAAINDYGPNNILNDIRQKFSNLASITDDNEFIRNLAQEFRVHPQFAKENLGWYRNQINAVVDNFYVLADEAGRELEVTELVRINLRQNNASDVRKENPNQDENEEGREETGVEGIENQYKETWMFEYDTTSNWSKMPSQVRRMLTHCPVEGRNTRFGTPYRWPVMQTMNTLIDEMQGVNYSNEMDELFGALITEYPWLKYIREEIAKDPQLKTNLFNSITRYGQSLGIIERNSERSKSRDMTKSSLKIVNSAKTVNSIYSGIEYQLLSGVPLNKRDSIYNGEKLDKNGIKHIKDLLDSYSDDDWKRIVSASPAEVKDLRAEYPNLIRDVREILAAIGVSATEADVRMISARDVREKMVSYKNNLGGLMKLADQLLDQIIDNEYETVDDLVNEDKNLPSNSAMRHYREISKLLTLTDKAAIEPCTREKGKSHYSNVLRSSLDDLIIGLQGRRYSHISENGQRVNMTPAEYIIETFGDDPSFARKETDADGNVTYHFRNHILEEIANGETYYTPSYVTILDIDTRGKDKQEQKNLTQIDRLNSMFAMYHMNENADKRYENTKGYWFPIPLPSDSGRIAYISFLPVANTERQDEIIKEAIVKELERMTDPNYPEYNPAKEKNNPVITNVPLTLRMNKGKFCTFPYLNDADIAGYSVNDIVDTYLEAHNSGQYSKLNQVLNELVDVVRNAIVEKFSQENEDFYKDRVNATSKDEVDEVLIEESIFQMSMNELMNGDPAYYSGYNTGSDNIQKRGKQGIVPKGKLDIYNSDFLDSYREYHGIEPDIELSPEDITEHCLYITDPQMPSPSYDDLVMLYDDALENGVIDKTTHDSFINSAKKIKHTDGQAFRSFQSMKTLLYGLGTMKSGDDLDQALDRISTGQQQSGDTEIVLTAIKPFLDGKVKVKNPDGTIRLMQVQHKLSEQVLTSALIQASSTRLGSSPALRALNDFMNEQRIDVAIFTSGVKVGNNGAIEFGDVDPESASYDEILSRLRDSANKYRAATGESLVHQIPYSFYGIVAQNPDSGMDESEIPIGTQLQKLIAADLPDKVQISYRSGGKMVTRYEEAKYPVDGVGDLTRKEVIAFYNKLMTEKIMREYKKVTGVFANKKKLSDALMRACRNSSRNSAYLERAFSLDEYGNFVIPLCDMATMNMSSEFLNSIVKNAVSRITSPGKQLVSMSAFGIANDLKIEFERDEDGYPIRYTGIDCLLPAWSRHIIERCTDERGVIDFSKMADESPRLLRLIGVRIPTQFKNFILPMKCVGFLPTILGDTIVTAIDSVTMLDADFDNDKVPTLFPSFAAHYHVDNWKDSINKAYNKYIDSYYDYSKLKKDYDSSADEGFPASSKDLSKGYGIGDFISDRKRELGLDEFNKLYRKPDAPEGEPISRKQYTDEHEVEYLRPGGPKLEYIEYDPNKKIEDQSDEAINNALISCMYGMLTGRAVSHMSLASGDTGPLKKIKRELEAIIPKTKYSGYDGPADISSRITQETKNNDGKQMIAVFANAESMQAIFQHTGIELNRDVAVRINNRILTSLHDMKIADSLDYISRYIGTALGGAADNSKDPILSVMNINLRTAPVVSLMLQLGYTMREVAFFLNIPSIRHYTDTGNFGNYNEPDYSQLPQELPGTIEQMKDAIAFGDDARNMTPEMFDYCNTALGVFVHLNNVGERMRNMSSLVRGDSGATAPHGPIENNLVRFIKYEMFKESEAENPMFTNWQDVINYDYSSDATPEAIRKAVDPVAQAYISCGVVGAFRELSKYYPGIGDPNFRKQIKDIIKKYYGGNASVTNVKNILYSLYTYIESSYDCVKKDGLSFQETRNHYINYFPEEAARIISEHPELSGSLLFRRLKMYSTIKTDANPFISLLYEGTMLPETRDDFTSVWQQMFYAKKKDGTSDKEVQDLALDLYKYCYFRNGWRFGPGTYAHLAPAEARLLFPGYIKMLDSMQDELNAEIYKNFELQFVRNNLYDSNFCKFVPSKEIKIYKDRNGTPRNAVILPSWDKMSETDQEAYKWYFNDDKTPVTAFAVTHKFGDDNVRDLYYIKVSDDGQNATYALTTPLGFKDMGVEYSANEPGLTMPSVHDQSEVGDVIREKRFGKKGKGRKSSSPSSSTSSNSAEEPNSYDDSDTDFWGRSKKKSSTSSNRSKKKTGTNTSKAKSKEQVKREKDGGKKTKSKYSVSKDTSKLGRIIDVESRCATEVSAYTVSIVDQNSSQLNTQIHKAASKRGESHFVSSIYDAKNASKIAKELWKKISPRASKSIVLNLTGSYMNTMRNYATQEDLDNYALKIFDALKAEHIFISKVVSTGQPGMPLASARAAMKLGYKLELHPTADYKVYGKNGEAPTADKDAYFANIDAKNTSKEYKENSRVYDKEDGPFVVAKNEWTRSIASRDTKSIYVFEDNPERTSGFNRLSQSTLYGKNWGEKRIMNYPDSGSAVVRGLTNAYPLSTMKSEREKWNDSDFAQFKRIILREIKNIIDDFKDDRLGYKRIVLPVDDMLENLPDKFHKWFSEQMDSLENTINTISETRVDMEEDEGDVGVSGSVKVDKNDILSGSDIQFTSSSNDDTAGKQSNIRIVFVKLLAGKGIRVMNSSGETIDQERLFMILPKDNANAKIENWSKAKVYNSEGYKVTEDIKFQLEPRGTVYNLLTSHDDGIAIASLENVAPVGQFFSFKQLRRAGMAWIDDEGNATC